MTVAAARRASLALAAVLALAGAWLVAAPHAEARAQARAAVSAAGVVNVTTDLAYQHGSAAGTGMVLTKTGRVLTNNHVIRGATTIRVTDPRTSRSYSATVLGYSVTGDIAVLQLKKAAGLPTVKLGSSATVRVGARVTALGNAGGAGGLPKSSTGKVTGLDQSIVVSDGEGTTARLRNLIQIDAELEPGDSGGPLFNAAGQVIGIDTAASVGFEFGTGNEGYAVPINRALAVVKQVLSHRSTATVHVGPTPFLGVSIAAGRPGLGSGPIIADVADGTPAARAGLPVGALITRVDGRSVSTRDDFTSLLLLHKPGDTVTLRWIDQTGAIGSAPVKTTSGPPL